MSRVVKVVFWGVVVGRREVEIVFHLTRLNKQ